MMCSAWRSPILPYPISPNEIISFYIKKKQKKLASRGEIVYFLHCPKSNKNASDPKNSLWLHVILFGFLSCLTRLVVHLLTPLFGFMAKKRPFERSDNFGSQVLYLFEMTFFKDSFSVSCFLFPASFGSQFTYSSDFKRPASYFLFPAFSFGSQLVTYSR